MKMKVLPILLLATLAISISGLAGVAYAEEDAGALSGYTNNQYKNSF